MPKISRREQDPRITHGIMDAIPKRILGEIAEDYGSIQALADELSRHGRRVHRQNVSGWIRGTQHMSNENVLYVADALALSPLHLLDLTDHRPEELKLYRETYKETAAVALRKRDPMPSLAHADGYVLLDFVLRHLDGTSVRIAKDVFVSIVRDMSDDFAAKAYEHDCLTARDAIRGFVGDYRSIPQLAADAVSHYTGHRVGTGAVDILQSVITTGRAVANPPKSEGTV